MLLGNVWYAGHERATSLWKILLYDDIGPLFLEDGVLCFQGKELNLDIDDVRSVRVKTTQVAWGYSIPSILLTILISPCMPVPCYILVISDSSVANLIGWIIIGGFIGSFWIHQSFAIRRNWRLPWIRVEHTTLAKGLTYSYFAVCSGTKWQKLEVEATRQLGIHLMAELEAGKLTPNIKVTDRIAERPGDGGAIQEPK